MDKGYEGFCLVDPLFYESPMLARENDVDYDLALTPAPDGWHRDDLEDWLVLTPKDAQFPSQGWKIHVSATLDDAEKILQVVWDYCLSREIAFKFVRSKQLLLLANGKYAHRGSSGKFVTIYPRDESHLETVVKELGVALAGFNGPYILSDVRWEDGPLYVRYGAFAERYCISESGEPLPAIENADGELVPDKRGNTFTVPSWVSVPEFLTRQIAARGQLNIGDLPYTISAALHFSNGGGVYAGTDNRTGEKVVLKEARPFAGLAMDGSDAVARLEKERDLLMRLAGLDVVPGVRDYFTVGGHHFLVLDFVEGTALAHTMVDRYPLALIEEDRSFDDYTRWALGLIENLTAAVAMVHDRGIVIGDLHPSNVLVLPSDEIVLIDFEISSDVSERVRPSLGDPGFAAPGDRWGFDIDDYALACLTLYMFMPLTELIALDATKAREFAAEIVREFPVPVDVLAAVVRRIEGPASATSGSPTRLPRFVAERASWPELRDSMAAAIVESATPERQDRLFPGDIAQFEKGGLNLAYGAAGVLYALHETGAGRYPHFEEWLVQKAKNPTPGTRLGFYDGLHGVAWALDSLGRRDDALDVLGICTRELEGQWQDFGLDLLGGLAGIGLNLCHFAEITGDSGLWQAAAEVAGVVADDLGDVEDVSNLSSGDHPYAGLTRGASGPALFFMRLHDHFGDEQLLDLAETALRQDIRRCVLRSDGALEVNEGYRTMPYVHDGTVGIGLVLDDYLRRRNSDELTQVAEQIRVAATSEFYIEPSLFSGRAGMIYYLNRRAQQASGFDPVVSGHIQRLGWHAINVNDTIAFPGDQLMRLSMDLATGTAGVLLAVGAALHDRPVELPFLGPIQRAANAHTEGGE